ncbi:protein windpipe isoform X2 [Chelonus insularis]|nr:protein windpipe isoform X2 [Chelonus insularis]
MELTVAHSSLVFFLTLVLLLSEARPSNGLCNVRKNGTLARCNYLEDIKTIDTYQLKSLKVSVVGKHLSAEYFGNLTNLRHLDLSNGKLKKVEAGCFHHLRSLRSLDLSNNQLTHLGSGVLMELKHLQVLNLSRNSLERIPDDLTHCKDFKVLDLSDNPLLCDCKALKLRDVLIKRKVVISKKTKCSEPSSIKGQLLIEPDIQRVCMFDELYDEDGMQMDQPLPEISEGSGEGSGDAFDELEADDIPDENDNEQSTEFPKVDSTTVPIEIPLTPGSTSSADDGIFFSEETDKHTVTSPITKSIEATTPISVSVLESSTEIKKTDAPVWTNEGSGDDDIDDAWIGEGSGIEGSGVHISHISWDEDPIQTRINQENINGSTTSTTESEGIIDTFFSLFWGTTAATPSSTTEDIDLEEEQFIKASTEEPASKSSLPDTEIIVPVVVSTVDKEKDTGEQKSLLENSKIGQVKAEPVDDSTETADASAAQQSKKGMGSYVVLAVLLGVLAVLIGFAAYKGDFCKERRKRNNRNIEASDMENGTEMKDLRKTLLENSNSVQPKISSNGKPEEVPLVTSSAPVDSKDNELTSKYVGVVNESSADPVKPPRKSFSPNEIENGRKTGTNGKISPQLSTSDNVQNSRIPVARDVLVNGKNDRDSLSSVGETHSLGSHSTRLSNSRLSQGLPPASPGAQRVKITLQDNPDSVPKTPLLITRTKAGENLVKTP